MPINHSLKPSFALRALGRYGLCVALLLFAFLQSGTAKAEKQPVDYVNAFIGTTNSAPQTQVQCVLTA